MHIQPHCPLSTDLIDAALQLSRHVDGMSPGDDSAFLRRACDNLLDIAGRTQRLEMLVTVSAIPMEAQS